MMLSKNSAAAPDTPVPAIEKTVIALISAVQFINILEFMMVMPLGPDFAKALNIPTAHIGYIGGSYTAAASIAGLLGALFLERFDRRKALAAAMCGLVIATLAASLATSFATLIFARILAGIFGGPAAALSLAIIADTIPPQRRGKAMGIVMGSFALASVFGVPAGLELARWGTWRTPFFCVSALGVVVAGLAIYKLPTMTAHIQANLGSMREPIWSWIRRPLVLMSYLTTVVVMLSGFMLIPNLSAYLQGNLHYPREKLGILYMVGGCLSFFSMRWVGSLTDRFGAFLVGSVGAVIMALVTYFGFINYQPAIPVVVIFAGFMVASSIRNVPYNALNSKIPKPQERAGFMSIQSAIQHMSAAFGAFVAAHILVENSDGSLGRMEDVAWIALVIGMLLPVLLFTIERQVKRNSQSEERGGFAGSSNTTVATSNVMQSKAQDATKHSAAS